MRYRRITNVIMASILGLGAIAMYPTTIEHVFKRIHRNQPKITSLEEAYKVLEEEKEKLEIQDNISLVVDEDNKLRKYRVGATCRKNDYGTVIIANKLDLKRILLRHEIYHHFQKACNLKGGANIEEAIRLFEEEKKNFENRPFIDFLLRKDTWKYLYFEAASNTYALTGLKF